MPDSPINANFALLHRETMPHQESINNCNTACERLSTSIVWAFYVDSCE